MKNKSGRELAGIAKNMVLGSLANKNKPAKTVDTTPTWESLVPLFMEWIQNGNPQQYEEAKRNLLQMAKISDSYRKNKSLFEASPDMYEALESALSFIENKNYCKEYPMLEAQLKSAIAKADKKQK